MKRDLGSYLLHIELRLVLFNPKINLNKLKGIIFYEKQLLISDESSILWTSYTLEKGNVYGFDVCLGLYETFVALII
jgi:hypothetical protein